MDNVTSVPGLERGIAILRMFRHDRVRICAPEVAAELNIPRSTVHRLLNSLLSLNLLRREPGGLVALGPGVLTLGFEFLASLDIVELSNPVLAHLRDEIDWSAHLAIRDGVNVVYLARHPSRSAIASNIGVGSSLPAHATIMGRLLLSDLEHDELRALYPDGKLKRIGKQTPATLGALEDMIAEDRLRGYAVSEGFYEAGLLAIAAPVRNARGRIVAAINATSVVGTVDQKALNGLIREKVVSAAEQISTLLGARRVVAAGVSSERRTMGRS